MLEFLLIMGTGCTIDTWGLWVILIYLLQNRKHWIDFFLLLLFKNIALFWHAVIKACIVQSSSVFPGSLSQEGSNCFLSLPHRIGSPDLQFWKPVDSKSNLSEPSCLRASWFLLSSYWTSLVSSISPTSQDSAFTYVGRIYPAFTVSVFPQYPGSELYTTLFK